MKRFITFLLFALCFSFVANAQQDLKVLKLSADQTIRLGTKEIKTFSDDTSKIGASATNSLPTAKAVHDYVAGATLTITGSVQSVTYSSTGNTVINFAQVPMQTIVATGTLTVTTSNVTAGKSLFVRVTGGSSTRTLSFPGTWTFIGSSVPISLAANKTAILFLRSYGSGDSNVIAEWVVQP